MFEAYADWVRTSPFASAALQFAVLGTLGELVPWWLRSRRILPCTQAQLLGKVAGWALMGLLVKFGFLMMKGGAAAVLDHGLVPPAVMAWLGGGGAPPESYVAWAAHGPAGAAFGSRLGWALLVSVLTNCFFGPQLMFFHRLCDNVILRQRHWVGLEKAWWTLIWFWIPAHTVTFLLPADLQIGLAALWGVVLGLIMGTTTHHKGTR